jgi:DNA-binding XRE family transcriptional regulator
MPNLRLVPQKFELELGEKVEPGKLGEWLRRIRRTAGVTQLAVAERLGAQYQNLSRLENGRGEREPMLSTMMRYLDALGWELVLVARPRKGRGG